MLAYHGLQSKFVWPILPSRKCEHTCGGSTRHACGQAQNIGFKSQSLNQTKNVQFKPACSKEQPPKKNVAEQEGFFRLMEGETLKKWYIATCMGSNGVNDSGQKHEF